MKSAKKPTIQIPFNAFGILLKSISINSISPELFLIFTTKSKQIDNIIYEIKSCKMVDAIAVLRISLLFFKAV